MFIENWKYVEFWVIRDLAASWRLFFFVKTIENVWNSDVLNDYTQMDINLGVNSRFYDAVQWLANFVTLVVEDDVIQHLILYDREWLVHIIFGGRCLEFAKNKRNFEGSMREYDTIQ